MATTSSVASAPKSIAININMDDPSNSNPPPPSAARKPNRGGSSRPPPSTAGDTMAGACCCGAVISILVLLTLLILSLLGVFGPDPSPLTFHVLSITTPTTTPFTLTATTTTATTTAAATVNTAFNITFHIVNPNYGFLYEPANVSVYYHRPQVDNVGPRSGQDYYLSSSSVNSFCPSSTCRFTDNEAWVPVTVVVPSVPILDDLAAFTMAEDLKRGEYGISIRIIADYRRLDLQYAYSKLTVTCTDVKISVVDGVMVGQPKPCKALTDLGL